MNMHGIRASILLLGMGVSAGMPAYCQGEPFEPNLANIATGKEGRISNRTATAMDKAGQPAIHFDERAGDGLALWPEVEFSDGSIEFDVRGKDVFQQSFVGVAFHGQGDAYEAVYFRPFNFRTDDPVRRNHAVQYISNPAYPWERLRKERPEAYEKPIQPAPDPNGWIHARIVVQYPKVRVFVNGAAEASLVVEQLSDRKAGWIGLWVGNGSGGEFANPRVSSVVRKQATLSLQSQPIPDQEPKMTEHFRATIEDAMRGGMRPDDYAPEFWDRISAAQKDIQADLIRHGELVSLTLVDSRIEEHGRSYRYILEFRHARALEHFVLDEHNRIALIRSEGGEPKPDTRSDGKAQ